MIVYNEAGLIGRSLSALKDTGFTDFVILDMESDDGTSDIVISILKSQAKILPYPRKSLFRYGYAEARNVCASFARREWVLFVDADEVIKSGAEGSSIKLSYASNSPDAYYISRNNLAFDSPSNRDKTHVFLREQHCRLYRPSVGCRWQGLIHEEIGGDLGVPGVCSIEIDHYSALKARDDCDKKGNLYSMLLLRAFYDESLRIGTNAWWYTTYVPENFESILRDAQVFCEENGLEKDFYLPRKPAFVRGDSSKLSTNASKVARLWAEAEFSKWEKRACDEPRGFFDNVNKSSASCFIFEISGSEVRIREKPQRVAAFLHRASLYQSFLEGAAKAVKISPCTIAIEVEDEGRDSLRFPVFSFQRTRHSCNLVLPDIDFISNGFYRKAEFNVPDTIPFDDKLSSAIFVGSTTGGGHITHDKLDDNLVPRIRLARFARQNPRIIVRLPNITQCSPDVAARLLEEGYGGASIAWKDQCLHRFLISLDGNGATCSRVYLSLVSNSVLLKYTSAHELFYFRGLQDGRHFIEIERDEDLLKAIDIDPEKARAIAIESRDFANEYLNVSACIAYTAELINLYADWIEGWPQAT